MNPEQNKVNIIYTKILYFLEIIYVYNNINMFNFLLFIVTVYPIAMF
jgi:hypothetical protein